jgi:sulfur-oxidizing protein SoxY
MRKGAGIRRHVAAVSTIGRREVIAGAASTALLPMLWSSPAGATPESMAEAISQTVGESEPKPGRVNLEAPQLAENGQSVRIQVSVDSPMTAEDHVKTITVFSEKNPIATVIRFHLGPRSGRARVATNIRLAASQRIIAVASMSDGTHWSGEANVVVTLAACLDGG